MAGTCISSSVHGGQAAQRAPDLPRALHERVFHNVLSPLTTRLPPSTIVHNCFLSLSRQNDIRLSRMSKRLRWLFPCFPPKKSARPVDSPSDSGLELRGRIDPVPTRDPEPPVNTETVLHGSGSATPNLRAEPFGIIDIAPNMASQLDHADAPQNPIPKPDSTGTASSNPTPELSNPTGSATVVAPEPHSPVGPVRVAPTAVPDASQPVSVAPTPEPGLVGAINSAQDPTPELNPSVDNSTIRESPAEPSGRFSLSNGQKAFVKSIGKTTLAAAKAASTAVPTLAIVVGCLEFVVSVAEVRCPVYAISFIPNRCAICRSMAQTSIA